MVEVELVPPGPGEVGRMLTGITRTVLAPRTTALPARGAVRPCAPLVS